MSFADGRNRQYFCLNGANERVEKQPGNRSGWIIFYSQFQNKDSLLSTAVKPNIGGLYHGKRL